MLTQSPERNQATRPEHTEKEERGESWRGHLQEYRTTPPAVPRNRSVVAPRATPQESAPHGRGIRNKDAQKATATTKRRNGKAPPKGARARTKRGLLTTIPDGLHRNNTPPVQRGGARRQTGGQGKKKAQYCKY